MKNKQPLINEQAVYDRIKREWQIPTHLNKIAKLPLKELGVSPLDVNWLLNTIEWEYQYDIEENSVSLGMYLEDFIQIIVQAGIKQKEHLRN